MFIKIEASTGHAFVCFLLAPSVQEPTLMHQVTLLPLGVMSSEKFAQVRLSVTEKFGVEESSSDLVLTTSPS